MNLLIYVIDEQHYGIELEKIKSAVLAVEITPLPNSPAHILGAINVRGQVTPVVNTRHLLGLPDRQLSTADQFLLCDINAMPMAFWVDNIKDVKHIKKEELIPAHEILPEMEDLHYVLKEENHFILMYDLEALISAKTDSA